MILPSKQLPTDRSLLLVGAEVLIALHEPKTISRVWTDLRADRANRLGANPLTFDWFVLALDLLFAINAVVLERGRIRKATP